MSEPFLAEITMFAGNFAPRGWAYCDGQLLPINNYQALYSLLGTTYGGDGRTTFGLPDLRGRAGMHWGDGAGLSSRSLGEKVGQENVTLSIAQIPSHNHNINCLSTEGNLGAPNGAHFAASTVASGDSPYNATADATMNSLMVANTGGSQQHTNMQPFQCVHYIIALQGIFPSRS